MDVLLDGLLAMHGKRETGDRGEVGGVRTVRVTAGEGERRHRRRLAGGHAVSAARSSAAGGAGTLELDDWNKDFALRAPTKERDRRLRPEDPSRASEQAAR